MVHEPARSGYEYTQHESHLTPLPAKRADLLAIIDEGWEPNSFRTHQETAKLHTHNLCHSPAGFLFLHLLVEMVQRLPCTDPESNTCLHHRCTAYIHNLAPR